MVLFDVRVFNPNARRYAKRELSKTYQLNEKEKKRLCNERIMQVEHDTFTPLVMIATGGMGREYSKFHSWLSELISEKSESSYSIVATWIRRKIIFALIKSTCMCLRGSWSVFHRKKRKTWAINQRWWNSWWTLIESLRYYNTKVFCVLS